MEMHLSIRRKHQQSLDLIDIYFDENKIKICLAFCFKELTWWKILEELK